MKISINAPAEAIDHIDDLISEHIPPGYKFVSGSMEVVNLQSENASTLPHHFDIVFEVELL